MYVLAEKLLWRLVAVEDVGIPCFKHVVDELDQLCKIELDTVLESSLVKDGKKLEGSFSSLHNSLLYALLIPSLLFVLYSKKVEETLPKSIPNLPINHAYLLCLSSCPAIFAANSQTFLWFSVFYESKATFTCIL